MTDPLPSLVTLFQALSVDSGALRARMLTALLNDAIAAGATILRCPDDWGEDWKAALVGLTPQPITLSLPWQAYHLAQAGANQPLARSPEGVRKILCTVPFEYVARIPLHDPFVKMTSDSVLNCVAELIRSAKTHLYVLAPYWRTTGVDQLKRRVGEISLSNIEVTLITAANMSLEDAAGCDSFVRWLTAVGARVSHWVPKPLIGSGFRPLMHMKAVVVDSRSCYIGSANFSSHGFQNSIEMGTWIDGAPATKAESFIIRLLTFCERPEPHSP